MKHLPGCRVGSARLVSWSFVLGSLAGCASESRTSPSSGGEARESIAVASLPSGARLWLRAEDLGGGAVASWLDASGNANHANQATAGKRPLLVANAINGRPAVRFDGVDDRLDLAGNVFATSSFPLTVIAVVRTSDDAGHLAGTGSSGAGYLTSYGGALTVVGGRATLKANNASAGVHLQAGAGLGGGAARIVSAVAVSAASALFVDGEPQGTSGAALNAYPYGKSSLGSSDGSSSGASQDPFAGELAELIVYPRALTEVEREDAEAYLAERYAISLYVPVGCDGVPGSGAVRDACGVCQGDGASCAAVVPAGRALWLRGDDLVGPSGGAVESWLDVSGQSAHASQATAARRPQLVAGAIGGHAAVAFDGVDDRLDLASNVFAAARTSLTVLAVVKTSDASAHLAGTGSSGAGYLTTYGNALTVVNGRATMKANSAGVGLHLSSMAAVNDGAARLISTVAKPGSSEVHVGCAAQGLSGAPPTSYAYGKSTVGASDGSSSGASQDPFAGQLAELIVYHRALSAPEREAIEDYLALKYGLGTCAHQPLDPAASLASSAVMFFPLDEAGTAPRDDVANGLYVYSFPLDALGTVPVPAIAGQGQQVNGPGGYHFYRPSSPLMSHGGGSFTWAGWIRFDSFYDHQTFAGKWNVDGGSNREYRIWLDATTSKMTFDVSATGAAGSIGTVVHPQAISLHTFHFVEAWHDAAADTINLRIGTQASRGSVASAPWAGGVRVGAADLNLGAHNTCADDHLHGTLDAVGYWTRVLTEAESARLWNGGAGFEP
jgi:Concanavalin A-like lectin/glucanases superfamily